MGRAIKERNRIKKSVNETLTSGKKVLQEKVRFPKAMETGTWLSGKENRYFIFFFFALTIVLYGNTLRNGLVPRIPLPFTFDFNQPFTRLLFILEFGLWGNNPALNHAVNLLLYGFLSILLFFTLKRLLYRYNLLFPFFITLVFMAHPVHTAVVADLKNRGEMIAFICGTGGLWFFLEYSANKGTGYVVLAMLLYLSGFLFSPSVLPFMGIYPLALFFFTELPVRTIVRIFVTLLVTGLIIQFLPELFTTASSGDADYIRNPLFHESSLAVKTGTGLVSLLFYLRLLLYPFPLIYYYGYDMIPVNHAGLLRIMISLVLYAFFFIYAILKSREKHFSSFAIFWYLLTVSWFSNFLFPVDGIVGEQYVFNASLGFSMILSVFLFNLFGTDPRSLTIEMDARLKIVTVFILVLIPFIVLTIKRNRDWYSAETLYSNDIKYLSRSAKANLDIGNYYLHKRDTARAITCLERSCSIYPGTALYTTLANLYRLKGDPLKAAWYRYQAEKGTGKPRKTD